MRLASWILAGLFAVLAAALAWADGTPDRSHEFRVTGMTCALCPIAIEKGLESVEGVRSVSVDQKAERVRVVAQQQVTPKSLESAIEGAGHFEAELLAGP
jgi:copper chaperone CopZ